MPAEFSLDCVPPAIRESWLPPFRGAIWDYARANINLQHGYAVRGPFDINSARHLIGPLEALRDPAVRLVSVQAAVQGLKSLLSDIVVPYWVEHDPGDILWLFETDDKAREYASTRAMPLIRSIPCIARMLEDVDRHDKTRVKIIFNQCNLVVAGLNESNVQSISYRYVIIDEAWIARSNGLIEQAIARTTQYPETKKILLLGQGGWEDDDFDRLHRQTDQRELQFACPFCGEFQAFSLTKLRGEDCKNSRLRGSYSGLSWDTNEETRPGGEDGRWNYEAVGKTAHIRCYHCDARIEDRPAVRRQLNDSYRFARTNPRAPSDCVGFHWPVEASTRIPLSTPVIEYLTAKCDSEALGYRLPLQIFYQKRRGQTWIDGTGDEIRPATAEPYDPTSEWPDEAHRPMLIDCQRDLQKFFYGIFAVSLAGEARELARGIAHTFDELAKIQSEWKVRDQQVFVDCGYEMTRVLSECVKRGHAGMIQIGRARKKLWLSWTGLKGSGQNVFAHVDPRTKLTEFRVYSPLKFYDTSAGTKRRGPRAPWYEWSNLHCKDLLRPRRDGDPKLPKLRFLPDTLPDDDPWSHWAQMRSEKRSEKYRGGKKTAIWELVKENRPNHWFDIANMLMAFMAICGIVGGGVSGDVEAPEVSQPV